jgi:hypothetical protein
MKAKGKWSEPGDEMVPIIGERVQSALRRRGMTPRRLATVSGELPQTIHLIVAGKTHKCRRSRRDAVAAALRVPAEWLSSQEMHLPYTSDGFGEDLNDPTRAQLAQSEFLRLCVPALQRDIERTWPDSNDRDSHWGLATLEVPMRLLELIRPTYWRNLFLAPLGRNSVYASTLSKEQVEEATEALARAFVIVLSDWFAGLRTFDFQAFCGGEAWLAGTGPTWREAKSDAAADLGPRPSILHNEGGMTAPSPPAKGRYW